MTVLVKKIETGFRLTKIATRDNSRVEMEIDLDEIQLLISNLTQEMENKIPLKEMINLRTKLTGFISL